ncbi:MAG TPA: hypothetical protein VE194_00930 [Rubrobacter sp.]|nr:hypothetical protein [Rubrobacter sp.]
MSNKGGFQGVPRSREGAAEGIPDGLEDVAFVLVGSSAEDLVMAR